MLSNEQINLIYERTPLKEGATFRVEFARAIEAAVEAQYLNASTLTDEQCNEFRRLPMSFNDMLRATYGAGMVAARRDYGNVDSEKWKALYAAVNPVIAYAGAHGAIDARGDRMQALMDAIYEIDGGTYNSELAK